GCLAFPFAVADDATLTALDSGFSTFIDDPGFPGFIRPLRYPVFDLTVAASFNLQSSIDPINILLPSRTFFNFSIGGQAPAIGSSFRSVYGQQVVLTPATTTQFPNGPSLAFNVSPRTTTASSDDPLYLTLQGPFTPSIAGAGTAGV